MSVDRRKLGLREDWPAIPYASLVLVGIAISAYDLIVLQGFRIQLYPVIIGVVLVIVGVPKGIQPNDAEEGGLWAGKQCASTRC